MGSQQAVDARNEFEGQWRSFFCTQPQSVKVFNIDSDPPSTVYVGLNSNLGSYDP